MYESLHTEKGGQPPEEEAPFLQKDFHSEQLRNAREAEKKRWLASLRNKRVREREESSLRRKLGIKKPGAGYVAPDMRWKRDDIRAAEEYQKNKEEAAAWTEVEKMRAWEMGTQARQNAYEIYRSQEVAAQAMGASQEQIDNLAKKGYCLAY